MSEKIIKTPIKKGGLGWYVIGEEEINAVTELLKNPEKMFRFKKDSHSNLFEEEVKNITGFKYALFVNSGTSALKCCLAGLDVGPGDEVILPAYTFHATAAAIMGVGAVPVMADIDESLGLDPYDVERKISPNTKAIIAVNMKGIACRLDELRAVAKKHNIKIIEDCCQAIGAKYKGKYAGVDSDAAAWSLNYFKVITAGEGGLFLTNDEATYVKGFMQSDSGGRLFGTEQLKELGIKPFSRDGYRGNELCAAVARVQLNKLDMILGHTRNLKNKLLSLLNEPIHYNHQRIDDSEGDCGFAFTMVAESSDMAERLCSRLKDEGVPADIVFKSDKRDGHIYPFWDDVLLKTGSNDKNYPWGDPSYNGKVEYSDNVCPNTLKILSCCVRFEMDMATTEQNIIEIAEAINTIDKTL